MVTEAQGRLSCDGSPWEAWRGAEFPNLEGDEEGWQVEHGEDPSRTDCQLESRRNSMRRKDVRLRCQRTAAKCIKSKTGCEISKKHYTDVTHLQGIIVNRIHAIKPQPMTDKNQHSAISPYSPSVPSWRAEPRMRCCKDLGFVYRSTIGSNVHSKASLRECMHQCPGVCLARIVFNGSIYALDRTSSSTGPEPLSNFHSELLPH